MTNESDVFYYTGKLTGQLAPGHQLVFSAFGDPTESVGHALDAAGILQDTIEIEAEQPRPHLRRRGRPRDLARGDGGPSLAEAHDRAGGGRPLLHRFPWTIRRVGNLRQSGKLRRPGPSDWRRLLRDPAVSGGLAEEDHFLASRDQVRAAGTALWKTGSLDHELKLGGGWRRSKYETTLHFPAPAPGPFLDRDGNVLNPRGVAGQAWYLWPGDLRARPGAALNVFDLDSQSQSVEGSLFLQDRIQLLGNVTLDLGVRADSFESTGDLTATDPSLQLKFGFGDMVAPRLGVAWDPVGKGRSRIFARYDRSYESVPLGLNWFAFAFDDSYHYLFEYPGGRQPSEHRQPGKVDTLRPARAPRRGSLACPIGGASSMSIRISSPSTATSSRWASNTR